MVACSFYNFFKISSITRGKAFLFHFPLAAEGLAAKFNFVVAVGFVEAVNDLHDGLVFGVAFCEEGELFLVCG